mgnify:CR=1 FL=1
MSNGDIWAITPSTSATYYKASAAIVGAGSIPLLNNDAGPNGVGYKVSITSDDTETATFTIVGIKVGDLTDKFTTEVVAGPDTETVTSTNYYAHVESITISDASVGDISIGTSGSLALPRTRVKGFYYVASAGAGSIKLNLNGPSGAELLNLATPASATVAQDMFLPGQGILTTRSSNTDYSVLTVTAVTNVTLFCG